MIAHGKQVAGIRPSVAGVASAFHMALTFIAWTQTLRADPSAQQIRERFEVSRATAYRWRSAWMATRQQAAQ